MEIILVCHFPITSEQYPERPDELDEDSHSSDALAVHWSIRGRQNMTDSFSSRGHSRNNSKCLRNKCFGRNDRDKRRPETQRRYHSLTDFSFKPSSSEFSEGTDELGIGPPDRFRGEKTKYSLFYWLGS